MLAKYQKLTDKEHILKKPDTYIGSIENTENQNYVFDETKKFVQSINSVSNIGRFIFYSPEVSCERRNGELGRKI